MFFGKYMSSIGKLILDRAVLPHLQLLDWQDKIDLPSSLFDALVNSSIQHLKIYRASLSKVYTISPPYLQPSQSWPLRSLHLELLPAVSTSFQLDVSKLCTNLLHLCASSLEALTWRYVPFCES